MAREMVKSSFEELLQRRDFILQIDNEFNHEQIIYYVFKNRGVFTFLLIAHSAKTSWNEMNDIFRKYDFFLRNYNKMKNLNVNNFSNIRNLMFEHFHEQLYSD